MNKQIAQIIDFRERFQQPVRWNPARCVPVEERILAIRLIAEELKELADALHVQVQGVNTAPGQQTTFAFDAESKEHNPVEVLDALTDLLYVTLQGFVTFGLGRIAEAAFDEVHASNLSKLQPDGSVLKDPFGKVIKGPAFRRPDLARIIRESL